MPRSRVRKLQSISDLQKYVEDLETLQVELGGQINSLLRQGLALSLESGYLRQQIAILWHKIIKDGGHRCLLKEEAEKLKMISERHRMKRISIRHLDNIHSGMRLQSLDFGKLSLGESSAPLNHGSGD